MAANDELVEGSPAWFVNGWLTCVLGGDLVTAWAYTTESCREALSQGAEPDVEDSDFWAAVMGKLRRLIGDVHLDDPVSFLTYRFEPDDQDHAGVLITKRRDGTHVAPIQTGLGFDVVRTGDEWHIDAVRPDAQPPVPVAAITHSDGWLN